jgi:hypothetical protein
MICGYVLLAVCGCVSGGGLCVLGDSVLLIICMCVLGDGQNKNNCLLSKGRSVMRQIDKMSIMDRSRKGELGTAREG